MIKQLKLMALFCGLTITSFVNASDNEKASALWQTMSLVQLRMMTQEGIDINYDDYAIDYLRYFDFPEDVSFKDLESETNELKIYQRKAELIDHLKQRVAAIEPDKTIVNFYVSREEFEEYDFDRKGFPVSLFNKYHGYATKETAFAGSRDKGTFYWKPFAWFKNHEFPDFFPMGVDEATKFIESLDKDSDGEVKRYVDMEVLAVPVEFALDRFDNPLVKYEIVAFRVIGRTGDYRGKEVARVVDEEKLSKILGENSQPKFDESSVKEQLGI